MSKRSKTHSVSISVSVKEEHFSRLSRMMKAGCNRSAVGDRALAEHFRKKDALDGGSLGTSAMSLDVQERFKMMGILASSMRDRAGSASDPRTMLIDTLMMCMETLKAELLK